MDSLPIVISVVAAVTSALVLVVALLVVVPLVVVPLDGIRGRRVAVRGVTITCILGLPGRVLQRLALLDLAELLADDLVVVELLSTELFRGLLSLLR